MDVVAWSRKPLSDAARAVLLAYLVSEARDVRRVGHGRLRYAGFRAGLLRGTALCGAR